MKYNFIPVMDCNMCKSLSNEGQLIGIRLNCSQGLRPKKKEGVGVTVRRCEKCKLIYPSFLPIPTDLQDHYGVQPENYWDESYFNNDSNYFLRQILKGKELIGFTKGMKALDIGAGIGKSMIALSSAGFDVDGIEASVSFRKVAIEKFGIHPDKIQLAMIEDISYPKESFDFITFGAVLEHLYDPNAAIIKSLSWIKTTGVIHIEVPSSNWLISKLVNIFYKLIGTNYVTNISPMHSPFHIYEFTLQSFIENGFINNYQVISYEYEVCSLVHIPQFLHPLFRYIMAKTNTGMQLTVYLKLI